MSLTILILLCCYTAVTIFLIISVLKKNRIPEQITEFPGVSVVVPFRNEQVNLPGLLQSLAAQDYQGPIEIILIDDGSTDGSIEEIRKFDQKLPVSPRVLHSTFDPSVKLTSKQQALELGFQNASFEWIALTDADVRLKPEWLTSLVLSALPQKALIFGHTSLCIEQRCPLHLFQAFQLEFLFAVAYAFQMAGIPGSCMGNNLLVSRSAYLQAGGQKAIGYNIVEDMALLNLFYRKGNQVQASIPFSPTVITFPEKRFPDFLNQAKRWALGGFSLSPILSLIGLLFSFQNASFVLLLFTGLNPVHFSIAAVNFLLTWVLIAVAFRKTGSSTHAVYFPLYYPFLLLESVILLISIAARPSIKWKNRRI